MKPIKIEPGSGTKMAGKWIKRAGWPASIKIVFVGSEKLFAIHKDGHEYDFSIEFEGEEWFEVDPPAPELSRRFGIGMTLDRSLQCDRNWHGLPIVIVQEDGNELRGKLFVEVPVEGME